MATSFTNFKNRAQTTLSQAVTSTASIWTLVDAAEMPSTTPFYVTCEDEIVKATSLNVGSNQICVTRGQDNTTAAAHSRFDSIEQRIVKAMFTDVYGAVNSLENQVGSWNVGSISNQVGSFFVSSLNGLVNSVFCGSLYARSTSFFVSSLNGLVNSVFCNSLEAAVNSHTSRVSSVHGLLSGQVVGTSMIQSLDNKTIFNCQFKYMIETIIDSYTITNCSHVLFINPSTPITINLTESTATTAGRPLQIKQVVTSFEVTIQPYTAQHIDSASNYVLTDINKYIDLIDCGSGWNILGSN